MAVIFMDGFDHTNGLESTSFTPKWDYTNNGTSNSIDPSYSRLGTGNGYLLSNTYGALEKQLSPLSVASVGLAFNQNSTQNCGLVRFSGSGTTTAHLNISGGNLVLYNSGNGVVETYVAEIPINTWNHIEFIIYSINSSTGRCIVKLNGATVIDKSNMNTGSNSISALTLGGTTSTWTHTNITKYDDVYVTDTNTGLGDCRIETIYPTADSSVQWTPLTPSTNYDEVDDPGTVDGDTTYVETSTATNKDLYTLSNITTTSGSVYTVQSNVYARKTDAGSRAMHSILKYGGTESSGSSISLGDTYVVYSDVFNAPPGGGSWDITKVNGLEAGFELDS